jgi:hypothetical protein
VKCHHTTPFGSAANAKQIYYGEKKVSRHGSCFVPLAREPNNVSFYS